VELINTIQRNNGEVAEVIERKRGEATYFVRRYPEASHHAPDAFVNFGDGTFAISNSEELVHSVIDRKGGAAPAAGAGSGILERFAVVDRQLPERALARVFVDARLFRRLIENSPRPRSPGEAVIAGYIAALDSAGAALVVSDDRISLEMADAFTPGKLPEFIRRAAETRSPETVGFPFDRLPSTALGAGVVQLDLTALYTFAQGLVPESDRSKLTSAETVLRGILLGQDLKTRILPGMGPRFLAYVDIPTDLNPKEGAAGGPGGNWPFPTVLAVELPGEPKASEGSDAHRPSASVADALDNGLNTLLALVSLDEKRVGTGSRIVTRDAAGAVVKTLEPSVPMAYAVDRSGGRVVVGNSAAAVERYVTATRSPQPGGRFGALKARAFDKAHSWFCFDLAAVQTAVEANRARLIEQIASREHRSPEDVGRDVDQMLSLMRLFDAAYMTFRLDVSSPTLLHSIGVLARPQ
jgi:hypothetical protein